MKGHFLTNSLLGYWRQRAKARALKKEDGKVGGVSICILLAEDVYEDEQCGVFLSIAPLRQGHLLVVPRHEADHWIDLTEEEAGHCFKIAQRLGKVLMRAFKPRKIGLMIAGLEVPHAHVHVVPIQDESDLDFTKAKEASQESLAETAQIIRQNME